MKKKSKAHDPFLEPNLIILLMVKAQNVKLIKTRLILQRRSFLKWTGKSHAGVIWPKCFAKRETQSPAEPVSLRRYYELLSLVSSSCFLCTTVIIMLIRWEMSSSHPLHRLVTY